MIVEIVIPIISIILAIFAFVISIITLSINVTNKKRNEMKIRLDLFGLVSKYESSLHKAFLNTNVEEYEFSQEKLANVYEVLCKEYLDGTIDKEYFESMYKENMLRFVQKEENKVFYENLSGDFNFNNTKKVYEKFRNNRLKANQRLKKP